ncbi:hypothetical protein CPB83DRAFT_237257 [Crepidotus variabilis]|uniref:Uncharacterized protein n=1 Tax=Crepidotus variabilis TaxID=179855 RepID=A0A9P6JRK1_9AGAR|nr:hypothetical protein CPB83DRAFT_237257 [Crepidotus variabilis]
MTIIKLVQDLGKFSIFQRLALYSPFASQVDCYSNSRITIYEMRCNIYLLTTVFLAFSQFVASRPLWCRDQELLYRDIAYNADVILVTRDNTMERDKDRDKHRHRSPERLPETPMPPVQQPLIRPDPHLRALFAQTGGPLPTMGPAHGRTN